MLSRFGLVTQPPVKHDNTFESASSLISASNDRGAMDDTLAMQKEIIAELEHDNARLYGMVEALNAQLSNESNGNRILELESALEDAYQRQGDLHAQLTQARRALDSEKLRTRRLRVDLSSASAQSAMYPPLEYVLRQYATLQLDRTELLVTQLQAASEQICELQQESNRKQEKIDMLNEQMKKQADEMESLVMQLAAMGEKYYAADSELKALNLLMIEQEGKRKELEQEERNDAFKEETIDDRMESEPNPEESRSLPATINAPPPPPPSPSKTTFIPPAPAPRTIVSVPVTTPTSIPVPPPFVLVSVRSPPISVSKAATISAPPQPPPLLSPTVQPVPFSTRSVPEPPPLPRSQSFKAVLESFQPKPVITAGRPPLPPQYSIPLPTKEEEPTPAYVDTSSTLSSFSNQDRDALLEALTLKDQTILMQNERIELLVGQISSLSEMNFTAKTMLHRLKEEQNLLEIEAMKLKETVQEVSIVKRELTETATGSAPTIGSKSMEQTSRTRAVIDSAMNDIQAAMQQFISNVPATHYQDRQDLLISQLSKQSFQYHTMSHESLQSLLEAKEEVIRMQADRTELLVLQLQTMTEKYLNTQRELEALQRKMGKNT